MCARGGWGWHHSKMQDASRVERLWLAMAVAMVWTVGVGSQADNQHSSSVSRGSLSPRAHYCTQQPSPPRSVRRLSCLQRGRLLLLAALLKGETLPLAEIVSEPWP